MCKVKGWLKKSVCVVSMVQRMLVRGKWYKSKSKSNKKKAEKAKARVNLMKDEAVEDA